MIRNRGLIYWMNHDLVCFLDFVFLEGSRISG